MEAIEEGYKETGKFELFSKLITDKKDVACPANFEIHLLIESPGCHLDTFSYGIIAEQDFGVTRHPVRPLARENTPTQE